MKQANQASRSKNFILSETVKYIEIVYEANQPFY